MPNDFNSSIGAELASLRALGAIRRRVSARDRLIRERRESVVVRDMPQDMHPPEEYAAD